MALLLSNIVRPTAPSSLGLFCSHAWPIRKLINILVSLLTTKSNCMKQKVLLMSKMDRNLPSIKICMIKFIRAYSKLFKASRCLLHSSSHVITLRLFLLSAKFFDLIWSLVSFSHHIFWTNHPICTVPLNETATWSDIIFHSYLLQNWSYDCEISR